MNLPSSSRGFPSTGYRRRQATLLSEILLLVQLKSRIVPQVQVEGYGNSARHQCDEAGPTCEARHARSSLQVPVDIGTILSRKQSTPDSTA